MAWSVAVLLSTAVLLAACTETATPPVSSAERTAVAANLPTAEAERRPVAESIRFDGIVEAMNRSTVAAQTGGRVMELPYDVGDQVPAGSVIVRLTSAEQGAQVDAAAGAVAEAEARLEEARRAYERAREVYAQKLISRSEYDRVLATWRAAESRLESARASLRQAREALKYTVVKAPYGGIVEARHVELGETVKPGTRLMTGLSLNRLRVRVHIPQQHIAPLRAHREAQVLLPDGGALAPVQIRFPPSADPATHSFDLRLELPEGDHGVFPGMLVKVSFVHARAEQLLIPQAAVVRRGELTGAYVRDEAGRLALRYLRLGAPLEDGAVPVHAGLAAGETVVTDPIAAAAAYKQADSGGGAQ